MSAPMVWRLCIVAIIAGMIGLLAVYKAAAHEWYPLTCCSGKDCMPVPPEAVRVTPDGYVIAKTGELLPWGDRRIKFTPPEQEDGKGYHWCRRLAGPNKDQTICLFVPQGGA
jgi:hypothetical protein